MKDGLERTIQSVIKQGSRKNVEYIIVDGLSNDGSTKVIDKYKKHIDIVIIEKDEGIFDAMNKGLSLATGEYIYYLNSGDQLAENNIIAQLIPIFKLGHNIISGQVATFSSGEFMGISDNSPWLTHQGIFVKSTLMKEYKFDSKYQILGDLDLWTRLNKDGKLFPFEISLIICNLELDGVGTDPRNLFSKIKEKYYYAKKHNNYFSLFGTIVLGSIRLMIFSIIGEKIYLSYFRPLITSIKKRVIFFFRGIKI